jgi:hypothetical protein
MATIEARLRALEKAAAARANAGELKLTREPMLLGGSEEYLAAVADGTVKDRIVVWPDESSPENPIL